MSKQSTKKLAAIIIGSLLIIQISFVGVLNIPTAQATTYTFIEDFSTTTYKDELNTTANWNTSEGRVELVKDSSDQIQPFIAVMFPGYSRNTGNPTVDEGRVFVVWRDQRNGSYNADIYEQLLNTNGSPVYSSDFKINDDSFNTEQGDQWEPDVASYGANSIVVWQDNMLNSAVGQFTRALSGEIGELGASNVKLNNPSITSITQPAITAVQPSDPCGAGGTATKGNVYFAYGSSMPSAPGTYLNGFSASLGMCGFGFKNTPKISTEDIYLGTGGPPVIAADSDENVYIAWPSGGNIYLQKFDKNLSKLWSENLLVTPSHLNIDSAQGLDMAIDSSGNVFIAFQNKVNGNWRIGLIKLLNGSDIIWIIKAASRGIASLQSDVKIAINPLGSMIYLVWQDNREGPNTNNIYFQKFENSTLPPSAYWSTDKKVSSNLANYPDISFDPTSGDFYIVWNERRYGDSDIFIQRFSQTGNKRWTNDRKINQDIYTLSGIAQSTKINTTTDTVVKATLTATDDQSTNTAITYYLSADGGSHWEEVISGAEHTFVYPGNDLRWKAELSTTDNAVSPIINQIAISYITEEEEIECEVLITCEEGYQPFDTGEIDEQGCPIRECVPIEVECETFITCEEGYEPFDIGQVDDQGCPIRKCVLKEPEACLPDGTLIKLPTDPKIYVIINCKKKWIRTAEEFEEEDYEWEDVEEVSSPVIEAYADYLEAKANLLRAIGHHRVYRIINEKRLWIPTIATFNAQGLKWEDIQDVSETTVNQYPRLKLVRATGNPKVYYLTESGLKRWISTIEVFNSYNNKWEDVVEISNAEVNTYPDSILIRLAGGYKVYKLENGQKRWIKTAEVFNSLGFNWHEIAPVNTTEINSYADGTVIE